MKKAIVIGSGIAGLATAIRLARMGLEVAVFEKNTYPGGKLSHFDLAGFSFDAGPSLFTQAKLVDALFEDCGLNPRDYFSYEKANETCRYFFSNGKKVTAHADNTRFAAEMEVQLGENQQAILDYLQQSSEAFNHIGHLFLDYSLHKIGPLLRSGKIGKALTHTRLTYLFSSLNQHNSRKFKTQEAVQLFNRFATYNGSNPYHAPAMLSLIPHLEMNEGTFYPKGGMISITNALVDLANKMGVRFHFGSVVTEIGLDKHQKKANGIRLGTGQSFEADLVVSNMDAYYTYEKLLNQPKKAKKILRQERSSSAIIFYWGISRSFDQFGLHNILFSGDYLKEFEHIFKTDTLYDDPTIYINITSKMESGQAPEGMENWFVMVNAPCDRGQNWEEMRATCRNNVLKKLKNMLGVDIEPLIAAESYLDPPRIDQRTASFGGSLYGTSSNSKMAAFMRHPNFSKQITGLYFVGGSVHPGGGIPLCLRSAAITANMIYEDFKI